MRVRVALFAAAAALWWPLASGAAGEKPVRAMAYTVGYSVLTSQENRISGLDTLAGPSTHGESHGFTVDDSGTMNVNVVAATADGGLVVDTSYDGRVTKQQPIRVAILADGSLGYDPKSPLCPQAIHVLPLLARGLVKDRELRAGASWTTTVMPPATGSSTYRVTGVETPVATIQLTRDFSVKGPQGYDEHDDGTFTYAADMQVPRQLDVRMRLHRHSVDGTETTDMHLTATLSRDSFSTPKA